MELKEFLKDGNYLPEIIKDFSDQGDLFKRIGRGVIDRKIKEPENYLLQKYPNSVIAHCYVVDVFLHFMAKRGYTLQKSRKSIEFLDFE